MNRILLAALLVVGCASGAGAQAAHDHATSPVEIAAPDVAMAGVPTLVAVIDLDATGEPAFHQDNDVRILNNGQVLYAATRAAGHDYDGVLPLRITIPATGTYAVEVLDENGVMLAHHDGTVLAGPSTASNATAPVLTVAAPTATTTADEFEFTTTGNGAGMGILEAFKNGQLAMRTTTLLGADRATSMSFDAGTYDVRLHSWGTDASGWPLTTRSSMISVQPGLTLPTPLLGPGANRIVRSSGDGLRLTATFDPYDAVGPTGLQHIAVVARDSDGHLVDGTIEFQVFNADRPVADIHAPLEHGVYQFAYRTSIIGPYGFVATAASADGQVGTVADLWKVVAPTGQSAAGPITFALNGGVGGVRTPGEALGMSLMGTDAAARPYPHADVDVEVLGPSDEPILWTKLHTHAAGDYPLGLRVDQGGDYTLIASPSDLEADAVVFQSSDALGAAPTYKFSVAAGDGFVDAPPATAATAGSGNGHSAPGLALAASVLGLAGVALRARRLL